MVDIGIETGDIHCHEKWFFWDFLLIFDTFDKIVSIFNVRCQFGCKWFDGIVYVCWNLFGVATWWWDHWSSWISPACVLLATYRKLDYEVLSGLVSLPYSFRYPHCFLDSSTFLIRFAFFWVVSAFICF